MDLRIGICDDAPDWRGQKGEKVKKRKDQTGKNIDSYFIFKRQEKAYAKHTPIHILFNEI